MSNNVEKLLAMLSMELIKVRETGDLAVMHETLLEVERVTKIRNDFETKKTLLPLEALKLATNNLYLEKLDGKEEAEINGWQVSYKSGERFALDTEKLKQYIAETEDVHISEAENKLKELVYSHSITKPSLKFKAVK